ncbi:prepilin type IV pili [Robbsia andropogonis]|nr:prepilin type IV pili [Robbsia andropogonis]
MDRIIGQIIYIAIGLLAVAAVVVGGGEAYASYKASHAVELINALMTNARSGFAQSSNGYTNFTTANETAMISAGTIPKGLVRNSAAYDPWGTSMTFSSANNATEGVIGFGGNETVSQCVKIVLGLADYESLSVGGTDFTSSNEPDTITAQEACSSSTSMTVTFQ